MSPHKLSTKKTASRFVTQPGETQVTHGAGKVLMQFSSPSGSVTSDANPEGVNQFTGAAGVLSAKAVKASKGARSPKGHVKAMEAHQKAAQMHRQAAKGEGHLGSWHSAMAAGHEASAMQHSLGQTPTIHFGRNFGDFPKVRP